VIAVDEGGPRSIVRHGQTGLLCPPDAQDLAAAVLALAESSPQRARLAQAALADVRRRTWQASLGRLADGYRAVLAEGREVRRAA
jgi:glycosyltransferase involved in cell wall biosynthesis